MQLALCEELEYVLNFIYVSHAVKWMRLARVFTKNVYVNIRPYHRSRVHNLWLYGCMCLSR